MNPKEPEYKAYILALVHSSKYFAPKVLIHDQNQYWKSILNRQDKMSMATSIEFLFSLPVWLRTDREFCTLVKKIVSVAAVIGIKDALNIKTILPAQLSEHRYHSEISRAALDLLLRVKSFSIDKTNE